VGTMAYRSKDLKHWTPPKIVFTVPEGFWAEQGGWAPEVHAYKGRFYLLTTLHNEKRPCRRNSRWDTRRTCGGQSSQ
jgi:beta-xylosidase